MTDDEFDISETIKPKSDQLNADDLLLGPITVEVTGVTVKKGADQPVKVKINNGFQPFLPCKSMRRVLGAAWGKNAREWTGKRMTLYRDPKVKYGGAEVGGVRISHLSHIRGEQAFSLTVTRGKREPYIVHELKGGGSGQEVKPYPEDRFAEKLPDMRKKFHSGAMTIDEIARKCESVGRLTAVQREKITVKEEPKAEASAAAPADGDVNF